eukprot:g15367.t1
MESQAFYNKTITQVNHRAPTRLATATAENPRCLLKPTALLQTQHAMEVAQPQAFDHLMKLVLIGDSAVGKSCLLMRFAENSFSDNLMSTIGIDFKTKMTEMDGEQVKIQVWDTAGQERFQNMSAGGLTRAYYRGARGIALVYDSTDMHSFKNIKNWIKNVDANAEEHTEKILLGNKCDLLEKREVDPAKAEAFAKQHDMIFFETSAKANTNVQKAFETLAYKVKKTLEKEVDEDADNGEKIDLSKGGKKSLGGCCKG